jgi:hemerythrin-like domain-containing protein
MCNYCGCRDFPLVALLTEQHDAIEEKAGQLRRAIRDGREEDASRLLEALVSLLIPHTATEERGLFAELRAEGSLAEAVERLCDEHRDIHGVLRAVDRAAPDWPAVLAALERLHRHIDNEEHGLFPAAVIALPIPNWDRITPIPFDHPIPSDHPISSDHLIASQPSESAAPVT